MQKIELAAKCAVDYNKLIMIQKAGISNVEIYTDVDMISNFQENKMILNDFGFNYAVHIPTTGYLPDESLKFATEVGAKIAVCHDIYWEDEWKYLTKIFNQSDVKLCVENMYSFYDVEKIVRRYNINRCVDTEHLQFEMHGIYDNAFSSAIKQALHIHITGYMTGTEDYHTHFFQNPKNSKRILDIIKKSGYKGLLVSEAMVEYQTIDNFKRIKDFFEENIK